MGHGVRLGKFKYIHNFDWTTRRTTDVLFVDEMTLLNLLKERNGTIGLNLAALRKKRLAGFCRHANMLHFSINCGEFFSPGASLLSFYKVLAPQSCSGRL